MSSRNFVNRLKCSYCGIFILSIAWIMITLYYQYQLHKLSSLLSTRDDFNKKIVEKKLRSLKQVFSKIVTDSSGMYRIFHNAYRTVEGVHDSEFNKSVSLVTHCSVNHMEKIFMMAKVWSGPIILTVFSPRVFLAHAIELLLYTYKCKENLLKNVTVHFLTEFTVSELFHLETVEMFKQISCNGSFKLSPTLWKRNYNLEASEYPNNLLRNVGIRSAKTDFVFVLDIDMIPSSNFHNKLLKYLSLPSTDTFKTLYVIPAFEIESSNSDIPENKGTLIEMWNSGLVRPFYCQLCDKCQRPTDYQYWIALQGRDLDTVNVAYSVKWQDPWEPYFVSPATMPLFDERFKQYGFNRISQVCELHVAGYQFKVLDNLFIVHQGFKTADQFHQTKDEEQNRNRLLFRQFKQELKTKYPESLRRCY